MSMRRPQCDSQKLASSSASIRRVPAKSALNQAASDSQRKRAPATTLISRRQPPAAVLCPFRLASKYRKEVRVVPLQKASRVSLSAGRKKHHTYTL